MAKSKVRLRKRAVITICALIVIAGIAVILFAKHRADARYAQLLKENQEYKQLLDEKTAESKHLELVKQHMGTPEYMDYYVRYVLKYVQKDEVVVKIGE